MVEIHYQALTDHIQKLMGKEKVREELLLSLRIYCLGTVSLTCEWLLGKYGLSPDELAAAYVRALPRELIPYLLPGEEG